MSFRVSELSVNKKLTTGRLSKSFRAFFAAAGEHATTSPIVDRLRAAQLAAIMRHSWLMVVANVANAFVLVVAMALGPRLTLSLIWFAVLLCYLAPLVYQLVARGRREPPVEVGAKVIRRAVINAGILGVIWGAAPVLFLNAYPGVQFIVSCICVGMMCGGAFGMATLPAAVVAFVAPLCAGSLWALLILATGPAHFLTLPLLLSYAAILIFGGASHARSFADKVVAQFRAEAAARHDPVTGLPNRATFDERLREALLRSERYGERFILLHVDLADFKAINDEHGYQEGDRLLFLAASRLADAFDDRGFVARIGGDEFAVIVRGALSRERAHSLAVDVACRFDAPFSLESGLAHCRANVGAALAPEDGADPEGLLRAADGARRDSRRDIRDVKAVGADEGQARRRRELSHDIRGAVARGEFFLQYQPIQNLRTGCVEAFEALVRWRHPRLGLVPPAQFIDIAEKTGTIHELGEWILNEACREATCWPTQARVAVNISGEQLCDASIDRAVEQALRDSGLPARRLLVEVTESAALAGMKEAAAALQRMHDRGVSIVLDDFGTGFSTFDQLRNLPVSRLKIDRSFVMALPGDKKSAAIINAVLHLANALDIGVTAEGVETNEQLAFLIKAGCPTGQGYIFARPLSAADARAMLDAEMPLERASA